MSFYLTVECIFIVDSEKCLPSDLQSHDSMKYVLFGMFPVNRCEMWISVVVYAVLMQFEFYLLVLFIVNYTHLFLAYWAQSKQHTEQ